MMTEPKINVTVTQVKKENITDIKLPTYALLLATYLPEKTIIVNLHQLPTGFLKVFSLPIFTSINHTLLFCLFLKFI